MVKSGKKMVRSATHTTAVADLLSPDVMLCPLSSFPVKAPELLPAPATASSTLTQVFQKGAPFSFKGPYGQGRRKNSQTHLQGPAPFFSTCSASETPPKPPALNIQSTRALPSQKISKPQNTEGNELYLAARPHLHGSPHLPPSICPC